jgi:predicted HicB family RNase H-like nuclease
MREIRVGAIHNRTEEIVRYAAANGDEIAIPPGESVSGRWVIRYNEDEHPEMANIATENEVWFIESPEQITWGSVTFWDTA